MKKKIKAYAALAWILICTGAALVSGRYGMTKVHAEETAENKASELQMLYVNTDTKIYESDSEQSKVLLELPACSMVALMEDGGEWTKVMYQRLTGYVKTSDLQAENPNPKAAEEYADLAEYDAAFIDELERLAAEKQRSRIYGAVIIVLIVAIFGVGIFTSLRKKNGLERGGTEESDKKGK